MTGAPVTQMLDLSGAAQYLRVKESYIRRLVRDRKVRYYKLGAFLRFRVEDLEDLHTEGAESVVSPGALRTQQKPNDSLFSGPRRRPVRTNTSQR